MQLVSPEPGAAPLVHGYISCTDIISGDFPHDCERTGAPHQRLVCVIK
jgi:hypothetical protein